MKINEPKLTLEKMDEGEWRFKEAEYRAYVHEEFQKVLETHLGKPKFGPALRSFMLSHADHLEAFSYYALLKLDHRKATDALVFAHTAVAIGRQAFTAEFITTKGMLPTGWTENRPFLRALYTLMLAQAFAGGLDDEAIETGEECLHLDPNDRAGARLKLNYADHEGWKLARQQTAENHGKHFQLSKWYRTYDWVSNDGFNNFSTWIA